MKEPKVFENYPIWVVLFSNLANFSVYFAGACLLYLAWPVLLVPFLLYLIWLEVSVYKEGCVNCCYFGRICAFGRGKIAKLFFKKGDLKKFSEKSVDFKDLLPSFLPSIIPLIVGIYLLLKSFSWLILALAVWPMIVAFAGNPVIYGEIACPHCQQARIGCPVCEFFMKKTKKRKEKLN